MADERNNANNRDDIEVPKKVEQADQIEQPDQINQADGISPDPADAIPVPIAMTPAEIDKRAEVVEAVRGNIDPESGLES